MVEGESAKRIEMDTRRDGTIWIRRSVFQHGVPELVRLPSHALPCVHIVGFGEERMEALYSVQSPHDLTVTITTLIALYMD